MSTTAPRRPPGESWRYYAYEPSFVLCYVAMSLFFVAFLVHAWLMKKYKAWYMWPFALGVLGESVGYATRRWSAEHPMGRSKGLVPFIISSLFVILAPASMAAAHYMCFGRLITFVGEKYSPVRAKWVTAIFVTFDVLSFLVQGGGGSLYASDNTSIYKVAKTVLIIGFLIQIISFGIFGFFAIIYQVRARRAGEQPGPWTKCLYTLYAGCILILIRGIFRTAEFGSGTGSGRGPLLDSEAFYYGLEAIPIFLCTILFIFSFPGKYISSDRSLRLHPEDAIEEQTSSEDGEKVVGAEKPVPKWRRWMKRS